MKNAIKAQPLSDAQIMVLQIVKEQYDEDDLEDLRRLLVEFNSDKMQKHLDKTVTEKGYQQGDFENMLQGHSRKAR
ncbi:hypothetical protein [Mucilaginibacter sp.]|uniref:hypothetical protein n=1 Tax=Mucilaginibacter sp. TaxID=1882438 RepID=UPI003265F071